ncbi:DUF1792 domain-containing protein [Candidatus Saccharibacteria bacterium]|nr:DUF1792 domain-containing protein [Candidatus Saccharibacteria bacterium]
MSATIESKPRKIFRIFCSVICGVFWYYSPLNKFRKMKFMSDKEMIKRFLKGISIARYGDGELRIIGDIPSDFYQKNDNELARELLDVAKDENENLIVCFPKPLKTLKGMNLNAKLFWISNIFWNRKIWKSCIDLNKTYGNTQITRPYMDYRNKDEAKKRYKELKKIWNNKNICIIEGENTHLGEGNDLFDNANKIRRISAPSKNAFDKIDEILEEAKKVSKDYIFLIALGPTATVLVSKLSKAGRVAFDAGHIDIEYEWILSGAKKKMAVEGKAVNESRIAKNKFSNFLKQIKVKDLFAPFVFFVLLVPSFVFRLMNHIKKRQLWLVAENGEARDNGYHFYKYIRDNHPDDFCFYAIKINSSEYDKVAKLGNVIKYGSLKHWLYYMSANLNISSQKNGNPSPIFWYVIHVLMGMYKNRLFLKHGLIKDDLKYVYYKNAKFKYIVCGAKAEYEYVLDNFGYDESRIFLTGLPRWDNLIDTSNNTKEQSIVIMPTWRNWLGGDRNSVFEVENFENTDFYKNWNALLNDQNFINYIEKKHIKVYFYPHICMQKFIKFFRTNSKNIEFLSIDTDIQTLFNTCDLMITDYSSVAFDFAYLEKPVIYFQFDNNEYRKRQHIEGYFKYNIDGFGPVVMGVSDVVKQMKQYFDYGFESDVYKKIKKFYGRKCTNCSKALYESIKSAESKNIVKKSRKTVLHVVRFLGNAGTEKYLMNLIRNTNMDYDNIVVFYEKDNVWEQEMRDLNIEVFKVHGNNIARIKTLKRIMKAKKVDIVYSYTYYNSLFVVLAACLAGVKKRIVHAHCTSTNRKINRFKIFATKLGITLLSTDRLACNDEAGKSLYLGKDFTVVNNGIDLSEYSYNEQERLALRSELKLDNDSIVMGSIGGLNKNKNQKFMIEILENLKQEGKKYKLLIFGKGDQRRELEKMVRDKSLTKDVVFMGELKNINRYYNVFDVFLLTSFTEGEPFVLIEAQANGLPTIVSSAVSNASKINSNFLKLDLSDGPSGWANKIINISKKRIKPNKKLECFSIVRTIDTLKGVYEG